MVTEIKLLPCPFCGGENIVTTDFGASTWFVQCDDCPDGCPVETPKDSRNIVTNADRIRGMSDEELAKTLADAGGDFFYEEICGSDERTRVCDNDCVACALDWFRQPAKEEVT